MSTINRNKELNLESVALVNREYAKRKANETRKEEERTYHKSRKANERKENVTLIVAPFAIIGFMYVLSNVAIELISWLGGMM